MEYPMYRTGFIDLKDGDFSSWVLGEGVCIQLVAGRSCLVQEIGASTGQADSPVLESSFPFSAAIPSWSADTPDGTWLEVLIRASSGGTWSSWFSMGVWASGNSAVQRHSIAGQKDSGVSLDTDTLRLEVPADAFQLRIKLFSVDGKALPVVRRVCVAYSDPKPAAGAMAPIPESEISWVGELPGVPRCSQMVYPDGGKVWCSPTCVAMIFSYWRKDLGPCEPGIRKAVAGTYDSVYEGNGNWAFNAAYAASEGFDACVARFSSLAQLEPWLAAGVPVALSVSWNNEAGRLLSGAPVSKSSGHLTLLVGFDEAGDPIMHEPASPDNGSVRRTYRRAELQERWLAASGGACYLIHPQGQKVPELAPVTSSSC